MPQETYEAGKNMIYFNEALLDYAAKGYMAKLLGKYNGIYSIQVNSKNYSGNPEPGDTISIYFIDGNTFYIKKVEKTIVGPILNQRSVTVYNDYKKSDFGYVLPYRIETLVDGGFVGQTVIETQLNIVEINKDIDSRIFDFSDSKKK